MHYLIIEPEHWIVDLSSYSLAGKILSQNFTSDPLPALLTSNINVGKFYVFLGKGNVPSNVR